MRIDKTFYNQFIVGVTLSLLEGVIGVDHSDLFNIVPFQPPKKKDVLMTLTSDFNPHPSLDGTTGGPLGNTLRDSLSDTLNGLIDQTLQQDQAQKPARNYLGASRLGIPCTRALQYEYTQTPRDTAYSGQTLRIFEMGHALETMARQWLQGAGFEIETQSSSGEPYGFSAADGRIQGHVDGIIRKVPEGVPIQTPTLWECKSLNAKSWKQMVEKGVKVAKPVYAVQIALYQAYMEGVIPGLSQNPALLTAVNKDTAEIYHELVVFEAALAQTASDRAVTILRATSVGETLPRIALEPDHFECRFCDWQTTCWKESL